MSTEAKKAVVTIEHEGEVYEIGHRKAVPAAKYEFVVGLNMLPTSRAVEFQKKMFAIAAKAEAGKPQSEQAGSGADVKESAIQFQQFAQAIRDGDLTADEILSVNDPETPEEIAQIDAAFKHMFRAIADTKGLPESLVELIRGDLSSRFYAECVDIEEVKALADSFRVRCGIRRPAY